MFIVLVTWFALATGVSVEAKRIPAQIHLSLGETADEMVVTWSTSTSQNTKARFGWLKTFPEISTKVGGFEREFVDGGSEKHTQYIHRAVFTSVSCSADGKNDKKKFGYQLFLDSKWSEVFQFSCRPNKDSSVPFFPKITIIADLGVKNPQTVPALLQDLHEDKTDFVVHNGDYAYDMDSLNGTLGDDYLNLVQPLFANLPLMTGVGNHESAYDFLNYRERFTMPRFNDTRNLMYSFDVGSTHWVAYDTEVYFESGAYLTAEQQLQWLEADLTRAAANRAAVPWIIVFGHRPMYCSDAGDKTCGTNTHDWAAQLEQLFFDYGVDLIFEAHQHSYERLYPVFQGSVKPGPDETYVNPGAPFHIIAGAAGCDEGINQFEEDDQLQPWSAVRISDYGYGVLDIHNFTHLTYMQFDKHRNVADQVTLVREHHAGYN